MQRKRGRGRRSGGNNNNPNRHYESTGPDVKIRGSAQQILDKYLQYARDALTAGDRVKAEAHFQHAEHYARIVASFQKDKPKNKSDDNNTSDDDEDSDNNASDNRSDDNNPSKNDQDKSGDRNKSNGDDGNGGKKPKGRGRKPKEDKDDPMRVIGSDDDDSKGENNDNNSDDKAVASANNKGEDDAPKPRRRTYRKKSDDADSGAETEGVMSTLARGRDDEASDEEDSKRNSHTEAAE